MSDSLAMNIIRKAVKSYSVLSSSQFEIFFIVLHLRSYLLDENQKKSNMSHVFLFLPSTLDRKEDIMQYKNNVHLHPIDVSNNGLK